MIKAYCYDRCSTCRKALKWLEEQGVEHEVIDIKGDHPDKETIRALFEMSGLPMKKFFNTSGMLYRELGLAKKLPEMSDEDKLELLASDGMLVKRPLIVGEDFVLLGFKEKEWEEKLL